MQIHVSQMISHLQELGFLFNEEKSILVLQQAQSFLRFQFNSKEKTIQVPQVKIQKLSFIGKVTAMIPAIGEALHIWQLNSTQCQFLLI